MIFLRGVIGLFNNMNNSWAVAIFKKKCCFIPWSMKQMENIKFTKFV